MGRDTIGSNGVHSTAAVSARQLEVAGFTDDRKVWMEQVIFLHCTIQQLAIVVLFHNGGGNVDALTIQIAQFLHQIGGVDHGNR